MEARYLYLEVFLRKVEIAILKKKVLVAPLNWGIGHASRCVPVINGLLSEGHEVILASDGQAKLYLEREFPELSVLELPSYYISYPKRGGLFILHMLTLMPRIWKAIKREHTLLQSWMSRYEFDVIISDNRYGMYSPNIKSVILTHQVRVASPLQEEMVAQHVQKMLQKFDEVWVPDASGNINLSGKLGHQDTYFVQPKFTGVLSRMGPELEPSKPENFPFSSSFILAVISGPEPMRAQLEEKLKQQLLGTEEKVVIVGGKLNEEGTEENEDLFYMPFANSSQLKWLMLNSNAIICRSGYSTIMDLIALKKTAILVPTPGQTEQEYLGEYLQQYEIFVVQKQKNLDVNSALISLQKLKWNLQLEVLNNNQSLRQLLGKI